MACGVSVSTETVLQAVKFYTVVKTNFKKLMFRTAAFTPTKDSFLKFFFTMV